MDTQLLNPCRSHVKLLLCIFWAYTGALHVTYLLGCEKRLLGEAGDDDGVHVQLLPQLLVVRQLRRDITLPLDRSRTGGGNLIKG